MNEITVTGCTEIGELRQKAIQITARINANGQIAAKAILEMAKDLRTMKIEKLYAQLGYETFDDYTDQEFNIGRRQAYSYISVLEKLGEDFVQSNSQLGITKLSLLTQVNGEDREEVVKANDLSEMTVDEVQQLIDKVREQGEQLSMFETENKKLSEKVTSDEELKKQLSELMQKNADLENEIRELESRPIDAVPIPEPVVHEIVKEVPDKKAIARKDKEIKELRSAHDEEISRLKKEYEDKLSELRNTAEQAVNADRSSFKSIYAAAYKQLSELVGYIRATDEPGDRELYISRTQTMLDAVNADLISYTAAEGAELT